MLILEEHKVFRLGNPSLVITPPRNWLKYYGIGAGAIVEITRNGDLTIFSTTKRK